MESQFETFINFLLKALSPILDEAVQKSVDKSFNKILTPEKSTIQDQNQLPLTTAQVMEILKVSEQTVCTWRRKGLLPFYRKGGKIFYYLHEINEAIKTPSFKSSTRKRHHNQFNNN